METLIRRIQQLETKFERFRHKQLKETPTRTILIDPILEALGWDVRDPDEVELEYATVDGKSVDYALKINRKPVLLVEAKSLNDPLNDVKAITQVVGYAANAGIVWCILTNGSRWCVYRSVEKCEAPEKLMYEVSIDPRDRKGIPLQQVAEQLWRFSRDETARGTLNTIGEQVFTDSKIRKALAGLMSEPPRKLVNLVRDTIGDEALTPHQIKDSLARVWANFETEVSPVISTGISGRQESVEIEPPSDDDEQRHLSGKPKETVELYQSIDRLCMSIKPGNITREYKAKHIAYRYGKRVFCSVHLLQGGLRVWLKLKYARLENPPSFARDVSNIGHWGTGDVELGISTRNQIHDAAELIRRSFESVG